MTPQPLGVPPWPAGMLLLPEPTGQDETAARAALLAGTEPDPWPPTLAFYADVLADRVDDARTALAVRWPHQPWARYDRALLDGDVVTLGALAVGRGPGDVAADGTVQAVAQVALYSLAAGPTPPAPPQQLPGEVAALVRSARASADLEARRLEAAVRELVAGAESAAEAGSPLLSAALRTSAAEVLRDDLDDVDGALEQAEHAVHALGPAAPPERRAETLLLRGITRYHRATRDGLDGPLLASAVSDLQGALQTYREDRHPEQFAQASQYVALCYLVAPMPGQGDRIRLAVAASSLRAALRVLRPDTHPEAWASAQLNLANALQYLPSSHVEDNLVEAVELYEQLVGHRDPHTDPAGTARLLANQGNALAHLGILDRAQERLARAHELFTSTGDADAARAVDEVLAEITRARAR